MRTKQQTFLDFLGAFGTQLIIPVYQRVYAWSNRQCDTLWNDIMRAGTNGSTHFIGTVLFADERGTDNIDRRLDVIDGQQRTATLTLLLCALRDWMRKTNTVLEGMSADLIDKRYLHVEGSCSNQPADKLILSRLDRASLSHVIDDAPLPEEDDQSANVLSNYRLFCCKMEEDFSVEDAQTLINGIGYLLVITAKLEGDDRAQLIFESLNSKGLPLTTADLIRNLLLVNVDYDEQARLYEQYWAPIERLYADDVDSTRLNAALHGWLAVTAPKLRVEGKDEVYSAFKTYMEDIHRGSLEELLMGLKGFCETFAIRSQAQGSSKARAAANFGNSRPTGLIADKKLFGD